MKHILILLSLLGLYCQPLYIDRNEKISLADNTEMAGSWKHEDANLYLTFNLFDEYIVSKYERTVYRYGHVVLSGGFYKIVKDTLVIIQQSGHADNYFVHYFDSHLRLQPVSSFSSRAFEGNWYAVPDLDYELRPLPVHGPPVLPHPTEKDPVVVNESSSSIPEVSPHKKRPLQPELTRPQRPVKQQPNGDEEIKQKPKRSQTR